MQKGLRNSRVAIIGVGATGTAVAELLARAGTGSITLIDRDFVELDNLERQLLFTERDVGMPKAIAAASHLKDINSKTRVKAVVADVDYKNIALVKADLVLDCTDNFETRFLINDYCKNRGIPWVYAAVIRDTGTVYNVMPEGACFSCVFGKHSSLETCDTTGVLNAVVTATASIQAAEAIRILLKRDYEKSMVRLKLHPLQLLKLKVNKDRDCGCCRGNYEYLNGKKGSRVIKLCGTGTYQVKGRSVNLKLLLKKLKDGKKNINVKNFNCCLHFNNITLFRDGRAIVKAESPEKAKSLYARIVG